MNVPKRIIVDQIIDSVVGAGLASVVVECKPLAVIKGV